MTILSPDGLYILPRDIRTTPRREGIRSLSASLSHGDPDIRGAMVAYHSIEGKFHRLYHKKTQDHQAQCTCNNQHHE